MGTKILKKMLIIICIIAIILPISSVVIAEITNIARGTKQSFGISLMHTSKTLNGAKNIDFGYKIGTKHTYRINAGGDYTTTILCLDKDGKFPRRR